MSLPGNHLVKLLSKLIIHKNISHISRMQCFIEINDYACNINKKHEDLENRIKELEEDVKYLKNKTKRTYYIDSQGYKSNMNMNMSNMNKDFSDKE